MPAFVTELIQQSPLAAGAIILAFLFVSGRIHSDSEFRRVRAERDEYRKALMTERKAVDEQAVTGALTNKLLDTVITLAADRQDVTRPPRPELPTAKEIGL